MLPDVRLLDFLHVRDTGGTMPASARPGRRMEFSSTTVSIVPFG